MRRGVPELTYREVIDVMSSAINLRLALFSVVYGAVQCILGPKLARSYRRAAKPSLADLPKS